MKCLLLKVDGWRKGRRGNISAREIMGQRTVANCRSSTKGNSRADVHVNGVQAAWGLAPLLSHRTGLRSQGIDWSVRIRCMLREKARAVCGLDGALSRFSSQLGRQEVLPLLVWKRGRPCCGEPGQARQAAVQSFRGPIPPFGSHLFAVARHKVVSCTSRLLRKQLVHGPFLEMKNR